MDALFIDEGFGALDPDALDDAITALELLRHEGRSVGVISHVPALRERIPAGLLVIKRAEGSAVQLTGVA